MSDSQTELRDVLTRHFLGSFSIPAFISSTKTDVQYFERLGRVYRAPRSIVGFVGTPRFCWRNANDTVWADPTLSYVQGFVQDRRRELVPHAWCATADGQLLEVTWDVGRASGAEVYFGVPFSLDQLVALQMHLGTHGWHDGFADVLLSSL